MSSDKYLLKANDRVHVGCSTGVCSTIQNEDLKSWDVRLGNKYCRTSQRSPNDKIRHLHLNTIPKTECFNKYTVGTRNVYI
jgi:hypothetical protein